MRPQQPRPIARRLVTVLAVSVALLGMAAQAAAQDASPSPSPAAAPSASPVAVDECVEPEASLAPVAEETLSMPEEFRIGLFEGVWQGIRDAYVDPETNGLDWEAIGDEYAPLIIATDNAYEVYELLGEMVALLEDPYTGFFAPEDLGDPDEPVDPSYGGIGALVDTGAAGEGSEGLRITYVFDGGSAKEAGIGPRDRVVAVAGDPCARVADIRGPEGTSVTLTVVSPGQEPREVSLERRRIEPLILPEARRLEAAPGVGYLRVIALSGEEAIDGIEQALTRFVRDEPLEGLVIDLRGSNQGAPGVILEALRPFVSGDVGAFHSRSGSEPIEIEPSDLADDYADVPVVVLVDEATEADAEQLAAILQDQGRATRGRHPDVGPDARRADHRLRRRLAAAGRDLRLPAAGRSHPGGPGRDAGRGGHGRLARLPGGRGPRHPGRPRGHRVAPGPSRPPTGPSSAERAVRRAAGARAVTVTGRVEVAGHVVAAAELHERRDDALARACDGHRATGVEGTASR